jgi:hypothetical protein
MNQFELTYQKNRISSLLNRWYLFYEAEKPMLAHQLDLMTEDFSVNSPTGGEPSTSREAYKNRAERLLNTDSKNAHRLQEVNIDAIKDGYIFAQATLNYSNLSGNGKVTSFLLHYEIVAREFGEVLPKLKSLKISVVKPLPDITDFKPAYLENRVNSLIHYFAAIYDKNDGSSEPFKEILQMQPLHFTRANGEKLTSYDYFQNYFRQISATILESAHEPIQIQIEGLQNEQLKAKFDFMWTGIVNPSRQLTQAKSHHEWLLTETNGRYPMIKSVIVRVLEAPTPQQSGH